MNKILVMRHGESIGNACRIIQGKSNFKLSDKGIIDVKNLVDKNIKTFKKFDNITSSTLKRAIETAIIVSNKLNKKVSFDPLLEEFDAGILEGLTKQYVEKSFPVYYNVWEQKGDLDSIPGAEKGDELQARVLMFLEKYLNCDSSEIVISHAGFIRSLINTVYNRNRTTPISINHDNIYYLENVWNNIGLKKFNIAKNPLVFEISTYDKKYIMKKVMNHDIKKAEKEKKLLEYLSNSIYIPKIIGLTQRDDYILKIMDYAVGENIHGNLNIEKINNTTRELYNLKQLLKLYNDESEKEDIIGSLKNFLCFIEDEDIKNIVINILMDDRFNNCLQKDNFQIVHDDLHRDNILYQGNRPIFLDFEGLKKFPSNYQLASYIAANFLLYDESFNIDLVLRNWPEKINLTYLNKLILFRLLKGYEYFTRRIESEKSKDDYEFQKTYKNSLIKYAKRGGL